MRARRARAFPLIVSNQADPTSSSEPPPPPASRSERRRQTPRAETRSAPRAKFPIPGRSTSRCPLPAARPRRVRSTTETLGRSPKDRRSDVDPNHCRRDGRNEHGRAVRRDASTARRAQPHRAEVFRDYRFRVRRRPCYRHPRRFSRLYRRPKAGRNIRSGLGRVEESRIPLHIFESKHEKAERPEPWRPRFCTAEGLSGRTAHGPRADVGPRFCPGPNGSKVGLTVRPWRSAAAPGRIWRVRMNRTVLLVLITGALACATPAVGGG